ncbi:MAG TPA: hypothetical protein VFJ74_05875 [Gemmatimonadaceae bacterium]|nr:hypothetical protein [Gemmatimonadaceae bacterium]
MPASLVVQLALWPDEIAGWARSEGTSESLVYNMLARRKPYVRMRGRLAERLEVPLAVLSHLIDARRPLPSSRRDPASVAASSADAADAPVDWSRPPFPPVRDGTSPIERRAVRAVELDVATMPASAVVGLALWPETLAAWSREQNLKSSVVWATLAGATSERVRSTLARRLGVSLRDLGELIEGARAEPRGSRLFVDMVSPGEPSDDDPSPIQPPPGGEATGDGADVATRERKSARRSSDTDSPVRGVVDRGQMELGL